MEYGDVLTVKVAGEDRQFGFSQLWIPPDGMPCGRSIDGIGECDYVFKPSRKAKPSAKELRFHQPLHWCEPPVLLVKDFFAGLRLVDGDFIGEEFELLDWCLDAVNVVFGMMMFDKSARTPGFFRLIQEVFACITRSGMKSAFLEGLICQFLAHAEVGREGIFAQQTKEEAKSKMVPKTLEMIESSPAMSHFEADDAWVGKTVKPGGGDKFRRGGGTGEVNMRLASPLQPGKAKGYRYSYGIFDEVGFMLDHQAEMLIEETAKYSNNKPDPLWWVFSTLAKLSSHYQRRRTAYAMEVAKNPAKNPRFMSYLYTSPLTEKPSVELALQMCPLFRMGKLPKSILESEFTSAETDSGLMSKFATERCGQAGDYSVRFMRHDLWEKCAVGGGREEIWERMKGLPKYIGCDFSETRDLSAMVIVAWELSGVQLVYPWHWVPASAAEKLDALTSGRAGQWILNAWLEPLPAGEEFPVRVAQRCLEIVEPFKDEIVSWGYDPAHAQEASTLWREAGWNKDPKGVQPIKQGTGLKVPIHNAIGAAFNGLIAHPSDPCFDYCVLGAQKEADTKDPDLERLVKPERGTSTDRIDGAVAWATAWQAKIAYDFYQNIKPAPKDWSEEAGNLAL